MYSLDIAFSFIFGVDENLIQIHNDKNVKLFHKILDDIALEICRSIS